MTAVTICYITGRADPRVDWVVDDLRAQSIASDVIDLLVIDARGRSASDLGVAMPGAHLHDVTVALPKPNVWQGPHRVTSRDWWAKSNAINTALALCKTDFVAFLDDRCSLGPAWLSTVRRAERCRTAVIAGTYEKIERDRVVTDHRVAHAPHGMVNAPGQWLFGCTYCLPLEWALDVNGAEEGCDGMGGEDYIFGLNLSRAGYRIDFVPAMKISQRRDEPLVPGGDSHVDLGRTDKGKSPNDKSHAALARFRGRARTELTPDLREIRRRIAAGDPDPWPPANPDQRDWYDGQLVREMAPQP